MASSHSTECARDARAHGGSNECFAGERCGGPVHEVTEDRMMSPVERAEVGKAILLYRRLEQLEEEARGVENDLNEAVAGLSATAFEMYATLTVDAANHNLDE